MTKRNVLPLSLPPRGLSRIEAAAYIGISVTKFDAMVADRRMPPPRPIDSRKVWDRLELDAAFSDLPHAGDSGPSNDETNPWNDVA